MDLRGLLASLRRRRRTGDHGWRGGHGAGDEWRIHGRDGIWRRGSHRTIRNRRIRWNGRKVRCGKWRSWWIIHRRPRSTTEVERELGVRARLPAHGRNAAERWDSRDARAVRSERGLVVADS